MNQFNSGVTSLSCNSTRACNILPGAAVGANGSADAQSVEQGAEVDRRSQRPLGEKSIDTLSLRRT
jgi:hypothetical protein